MQSRTISNGKVRLLVQIGIDHTETGSFYLLLLNKRAAVKCMHSLKIGRKCKAALS